MRVFKLSANNTVLRFHRYFAAHTYVVAHKISSYTIAVEYLHE